MSDTPEEHMPGSMPEGLAYDFDGNPITDLMEFGRLLADPAKIVEQTQVGDSWVSTAWVGTDPTSVLRQMHPDVDVPPFVYETAVFDANGDVSIVNRYPTRDAARAGHDQAVTAVREGEPPEEP